MTDHCVIDLSIRPPVLRCELCGAEKELQLPMLVEDAAKLGQQWMQDHAGCADPPEETWASHPSLTPQERNPNLIR